MKSSANIFLIVVLLFLSCDKEEDIDVMACGEAATLENEFIYRCKTPKRADL